MSQSLNEVNLIGNLGKDSEVRFTTNNTSITSFTLATTYGHKDKEGNWQNETTWHNITGFNLSDSLKESLKKGSKVYVKGRIKKNEYTDKDGVKRFGFDIIAERILNLDSKKGGDNAAEESFVPEAVGGIDLNDDDLPF